MTRSDSNPHIRDDYSPLQTLVFQALRRYGEMAPGTIDGDTALMFVEFANAILDEVRLHPYAPDAELPYYEALTCARPVPDPVMIAGLLYHYSAQQGSEKIQLYMPGFYRTMNQHLWLAWNGNTAIRLRAPDDPVARSATNGLARS